MFAGGGVETDGRGLDVVGRCSTLVDVCWSGLLFCGGFCLPVSTQALLLQICELPQQMSPQGGCVGGHVERQLPLVHIWPVPQHMPPQAN